MVMIMTRVCVLLLVGVAHLIKANMIKDGAAVIDVGESVFNPPYLHPLLAVPSLFLDF